MKKKYDYFIYYFPLFAFLFIGMGSILLSVSLSSCSSSVKNPLLLCADSLMEVSPDSALSILESISSPQKLSRADRALYALLLTQARHKNYVPLDDDSLIKTAMVTEIRVYALHRLIIIGAPLIGIWDVPPLR